MPYIPTVSGLLGPSSFATRMVAHHELVDLPGGPFVMGSSQDATPHWVRLSPFGLGTTAAMEGQFREIMNRGGNEDAPQDHPVTEVSWNEARDYFLKINAMKKVRLGFPTEAEWEYAARGPSVNLLEVMEKEKVKPSDFVEFVEDRFENFVERVEMGSRIFTDPTEEDLRRILRNGQPLYAWRVYGTPSGKLTDDEAWQSVNEEREGPQTAGWGPANAYGLKGMTGGVWELVADWYGEDYYQNSPSENPMGPKSGEYRSLRGGSWRNGDADNLRASYRILLHPDNRHDYFGFRVAAAAPEDSKR